MLLSRVVARLELILRFKCKYWLRRLRGGHFPEVAFYPDRPWARAAVFKICHVLGLPMGGRIDRAALAIHWEDVTERVPPPELEHAASRTRVVNLRCRDISKHHVERIHQAVFGYGAEVDPRAHVGPCVRKSDANAAHDGVILHAPLGAIEPGYVYQRVIDNSTGDGYVCDIRVPFIGGEVPFCYLKRRPIERRFDNKNTAVRLQSVEQSFSREEVERLQRFCMAIGLDYGELDVLRDNGDGRIYVVDVNNTPDGPPNHLAAAEADEALDRMAATFARVFLG